MASYRKIMRKKLALKAFFISFAKTTYLSKEEAYEYIEEFCFRYVLVRHIRVGADPVGFLYIFGWKDRDGHVR